MKVCIIGASGKLGRYLVQHCLDKGYQVVGVCRPQSVGKLEAFSGIAIFPGYTDDRKVIESAVAGCDAVLTVLAPWGVKGYATGTARAVLDFSEANARLVFSCGWHISKDGRDRYSKSFTTPLSVAGWIGRVLRLELSEKMTWEQLSAARDHANG